jgi:hypothetical protein
VGISFAVRNTSIGCNLNYSYRPFKSKRLLIHLFVGADIDADIVKYMDVIRIHTKQTVPNIPVEWLGA